MSGGTEMIFYLRYLEGGRSIGEATSIGDGGPIVSFIGRVWSPISVLPYGPVCNCSSTALESPCTVNQWILRQSSWPGTSLTNSSASGT